MKVLLSIKPEYAFKIKAIASFERAFELFKHPIIEGMYGRSEDTYMFYKEFRHNIVRALDMYMQFDTIEK